MNDVEYGRIRVADGFIMFDYPTDWLGKWSCDGNDVAIVGEYTTPNGPWVPDYFWVFVLRTGLWHLAPMGARREEDMRRLLTSRLGGEWKYGLCGTTDFASRVVCPRELAGNPIFEPVTPTVWPSTKSHVLAARIQDYLHRLV